ncbi:hypothetical protein N7499_003395 [Penicillium canescens]|uniref:Rhodopsin domain-containing protein n=1 Tax=Penicillium canescens TaxID=5083 RepID=A0AAD6N790_PENCN|nr:uncharacterized protein N7446_012322 [Penicillium canescens]KAJ6020101.1 hypothetical protein N7522_000176 [Penicillium canescens]KAJ6038044.1 hypothetical protein N7460_007815 [Penicillium canescens]KAJ6045458.1 hypothetical protein N7446_012322 [Penicillium canescens]KAJ6061135.1 hypothetical protein N7444_001831 [Penicillium canescens]KAJ6090681.1 hypothetical protein N7499_003395 [Penicillium canescens]
MSDHPTDVLNTINLVTQCLCISIVTLFVALRFYTRIRFKQPLGVDDYSCIVAWLLFMGYCAISIVIGKHADGYHFGELDGAHQIQFKKFCYIATILYCPMALSVKIALLSVLTRIFALYRGKVWFIYIFLGCLCCYYIVALIIKIRMCAPIPMYWLGPAEGGSCLDQASALIADSVISVVSDIIILILPLPLTWSLQMSRSRKLRVIGILGAGGLATGFSLYRLVLLLKVDNSADMSLMFVRVILSGNAEGGVGLICACLPILNVLLAYYKKTASDKYYQHSSNMALSERERKSAPSKVASEWDKATAFGDQSHLISFVSAPEASESYNHEDGIRKTVAVSQTVESS